MLSYLFCSHNFQIIESYFIKIIKKKILELFIQKIVTKLSKIWVWDPGSGIPDPGVKTAPDPGSGSATLSRGTGLRTGDDDKYGRVEVVVGQEVQVGLRLDLNVRSHADQQ